MWLLVLDDSAESKFEDSFAGQVVLGRQLEKDDPLFTWATDPETRSPRVNIACRGENAVSRRSLLIAPISTDTVRIETLRQGDLLVNGRALQPNASQEMNLPVTVTFANKTILIESESPSDPSMHSLSEPTRAPGSESGAARLFLEKGDFNREDLLEWFRAVTLVLHSAVNSEEFFQRAAQAMVDLIGLSCGLVLLRESGEWSTEAVALRDELEMPLSEYKPSKRMLARLLKEPRTFWQSISGSGDKSLLSVRTVVAAPILDHRGEVIGALYGDRRSESFSISRPFSQLEAMLVETLACSVAAGWARLEQQCAALAAEVRFGQFFSPVLARHLTAEPDLLKGKEMEVTLLFCDVRGFSRISERLGPATTMEWMAAVMTELADCVAAHEGVHVDYIGDELMAMWGAPIDQPDHVRLACLAACDMLPAVERLSDKWKSRLNEESIRIGIGINTGKAYVGNMGSSHKFKYGPLGSTVNLASRVQGATKYLRTDLVVTANTRKQLDESMRARRLCQVRVINIEEPQELYQLPVGAPQGWDQLCEQYEEALQAFEKQNFRQAAGIMSRVICEFPEDGPSLRLLARAVDWLMRSSSAGFTPIWELPGK